MLKMIDKKSFKKAIAAPLEAENFKKKGQSWYFDGRDAIVVLNLQKSDWGEYYYINIGIWLKALGEAEFPEENQCHLSHRLEHLFPEDREIICDGSSLEKGNPQLLNALSQFIKIKLIPFLRECTDENKLRKLIANGRFKSGAISIQAKYCLGIEKYIP